MGELLARLIERRTGPSFNLSGFRVSRSFSGSDDREIFEFRYVEFRRAGYLESGAFPDGQLTDEYDRVSVLIRVHDSSGSIVGTARFVRPSGLGFHGESLFDFDICGIQRRRLGEFGRLAVSPSHRGGARIVVIGILKAVFECMLESGTSHVLAFLPAPLADSFASLGCKAIPVRLSRLSEVSASNRRSMQPYFDKHFPAPVIYDLESMLADVGVMRSRIADRIRY